MEKYSIKPHFASIFARFTYHKMGVLTVCSISCVSGISQRKTIRQRVDRLMLAKDCISVPKLTRWYLFSFCSTSTLRSFAGIQTIIKINEQIEGNTLSMPMQSTLTSMLLAGSASIVSMLVPSTFLIVQLVEFLLDIFDAW